MSSVAAMAVSGNMAYVVGTAKGLFLTHGAVQALNGETGQSIVKFSEIGFLSYLPKNLTGIQATTGSVLVSNGQTNYSFTPTGTLLSKVTGVAPGLAVEALDTSRTIDYKLTGANTLSITVKGVSQSVRMNEVQTALSIGVTSEGHLLVLDGSTMNVEQYSFTTGS
jgi:hypothetical protein